MDPNANLREQEELITERRQLGKFATAPGTTERGARLRELRTALSAWLIRGGFEPDWSKAPKAARYYVRRGDKLWQRPA